MSLSLEPLHVTLWGKGICRSDSVKDIATGRSFWILLVDPVCMSPSEREAGRPKSETRELTVELEVGVRSFRKGGRGQEPGHVGSL